MADPLTHRPPKAAIRSETHTNEHPAVKTTDDARQGETGRNVRQVLITGISLVIIAFAIVWVLGVWSMD